MIGMPLKLMVSFLIISLVLPSVGMMVSEVREDLSSQDLDAETDRIVECIYRTYRSGTGATESVTVDIPPGGSILIGGTGIDSHTVRVCHEGEVVETIGLDRAPVRLSEALMELTGRCTVTFQCTETDTGLVVEATV